MYHKRVKISINVQGHGRLTDKSLMSCSAHTNISVCVTAAMKSIYIFSRRLIIWHASLTALKYVTWVCLSLSCASLTLLAVVWLCISWHGTILLSHQFLLQLDAFLTTLHWCWRGCGSYRCFSERHSNLGLFNGFNTSNTTIWYQLHHGIRYSVDFWRAHLHQCVGCEVGVARWRAYVHRRVGHEVGVTRWQAYVHRRVACEVGVARW